MDNNNKINQLPKAIESKKKSDSGSYVILLIEDNTTDYKAFSLAFQSYPVSIVWYKTAEEGWAIVKQHPTQFDLIVTDYLLPEMTGLDLCKLLLNYQINVPVVLLTGEGDEYIAANAFKSGVFDYIVKDQKNEYLKNIPTYLFQAIVNYQERQQNNNSNNNIFNATRIFINAPEAVCITDKENTIIAVNSAFINETGYTAEEVTGKKTSFLKSDADDEIFYQKMWEELGKSDKWQGKIRIRDKQGQTYNRQLTVNAVRNAEQQTIHYIGIYSSALN